MPERLPRGRAIAAYCKTCAPDEPVSACELPSCPLWRYRRKPEDHDAPGPRLTRARAIRVFCIDCMGGQRAIVPRCTADECVLYPFKSGREESA